MLSTILEGLIMASITLVLGLVMGCIYTKIYNNDNIKS